MSVWILYFFDDFSHTYFFKSWAESFVSMDRRRPDIVTSRWFHLLSFTSMSAAACLFVLYVAHVIATQQQPANSQFLCRDDMDGKNGAKKLIWSWKKKKSFTSARRSAQTTTAQRPWLRFMGRKKNCERRRRKTITFSKWENIFNFSIQTHKLSVNSSAIKQKERRRNEMKSFLSFSRLSSNPKANSTRISLSAVKRRHWFFNGKQISHLKLNTKNFPPLYIQRRRVCTQHTQQKPSMGWRKKIGKKSSSSNDILSFMTTLLCVICLFSSHPHPRSGSNENWTHYANFLRFSLPLSFSPLCDDDETDSPIYPRHFEKSSCVSCAHRIGNVSMSDLILYFFLHLFFFRCSSPFSCVPWLTMWEHEMNSSSSSIRRNLVSFYPNLSVTRLISFRRLRAQLQCG